MGEFQEASRDDCCYGSGNNQLCDSAIALHGDLFLAGDGALRILD